jgi:PAS domain S-box-containing protein
MNTDSQVIAALQQENQQLQAQLAALKAERQADITRLRQEKTIYRSIFEQVPVGVAVYQLEDLADDHTLRLIAANPANVHLGGPPIEEIVGKTLDENFPGLREQGVPQAFAEVIRSGEPFETEIVYGDERIVHSAFTVRAVLVLDNCLIAIFENITLQKQAEHQLRQMNAELEQRFAERTEELHIFKAVIDAAPDGIAFARVTTNQIFYANPAFRAMYGYGDQTIGLPFTDIYTESPERMAQVIQESIEQGVWRGELGCKRKDGNKFPGHLSGVVLHNSDGQPLVAAGVLRDLTEQKQREAERAALQQQIIDAQRDALRELSTPLIPISDTVMIMPLVGTVDSRRAQQIMEALLEGVARHQADLVILDITGVRVVDTQVAQAFIQAAQAVKLLGAQVMLTGIQPQIAQTLVHLGVDLSSIMTHGSLQTGITAALTMRESPRS